MAIQKPLDICRLKTTMKLMLVCLIPSQPCRPSSLDRSLQEIVDVEIEIG